MKKVEAKAKGKYKFIILWKCLVQEYIINIYIRIQYIWHTVKTEITTYHSSDRAVVKSQRKVPQFMTLENAYISFVENNVKETYKTF